MIPQPVQRQLEDLLSMAVWRIEHGNMMVAWHTVKIARELVRDNAPADPPPDPEIASQP